MDKYQDKKCSVRDRDVMDSNLGWVRLKVHSPFTYVRSEKKVYKFHKDYRS